MALPSGSRLGPYNILSPLGAGGFGEVYKARDTRLDLMATPIRGEETLEVGTSHALFNLGPQRGASFTQGGMSSFYDVTRDGQRFLVERLLDSNTRSTLTVVTTWTAALKK